MWIHDQAHGPDDPLWLADLTRLIGEVAHVQLFERLYRRDAQADLTWGEAREIIAAWASHPQVPRSAADRTSMSADLRRSGERLLEPSFGEAVREVVTQFLSVLPAQIDKGAAHLVKRASDEVTAALRGPKSAEAILLLLFEKAQSGAPTEDITFWCSQLSDVMRLGGHNGPQMMLTVQQVLRDDALTVANLRGDLSEDSNVSDLVGQRAGLSLDERLDRSLDAISRAPDSGHVVIWLFIGNAREFMMTKQVGPVTFIDGHLWKSLMQSEDGLEDSRVPAEVREHTFYFRNLPEVEDDRFVLARIDLGDRLVAGAVELAEQNVRAIGQLSRFWGLSTWKLWSGHIVVVDGTPELSAGFFPPDRTNVDDHPARDGTSYVLAEIDEMLGPQFPVARPELANLLECIEALNAARHSPDDLQLIAAARAVDHVARWAEEDWFDLLRTTYRYAWPLWRFSDELQNVVFRAVKDVSDLNRPRFLELDRAIVNEPTHLSWSVNLREAFAAMDELIEILGDRWPHGRRLTRIRDLSRSPALLSQRVERGASDFDVLINRARRLRNSIVHGGPQEKGALGTVVPLMMALAATSLNDSLAAVISEVAIPNRLRVVRSYYHRQADDLREGQTVLDTLLTAFPPQHP